MEATGGPQPPPPPPGWVPQGYVPPPQEPDNNAAVAGFCLAMASIALPFVTAGFSSIVSLGLGIAAVVFSQKGRQKVRTGETTKHDGLAQAGFWCGIAGIVISVLATIFWIVIIAVAASDIDFDGNFEDQNQDDPFSSAAFLAVRVAALAFS